MKKDTEANFLQALHLFFASLLESGDLFPDTIACPTDQVLFLVSIRPNDGYSSALAVAQACSSIRYCFLAIFVHIIRQSLSNCQTFTWFEVSELTQNSGNWDFASDGPSYGENTPVGQDINCVAQDTDDELEKILSQSYGCRQPSDVVDLR